MNNKGFTLVELLAVIIILSLLTLLATTSITKIVKESKDDLYNTQILAIKVSAETWGSEGNIRLPEAGQCKYFKLKDLKDSGYIDSNIIDSRTSEQISDDMNIKVSATMNKFGKTIVDYEVNPSSIDGCSSIFIATPVTDETKTLLGNVPSGNYEPGDEYIVKVNNEKDLHFYVLNSNGDEVNLIMSNNVNKTGDVDSNNSNLLQIFNNSKGPIEQLDSLAQSTSTWTNIPKIKINYSAEGHASDEYQKVVSSGSNVKIIANDGTISKTYDYLRARLPYISEATSESVGCTYNYQLKDCATWFYSGGDDEFWLMSFRGNREELCGYDASCEVDLLFEIGIRPVITLSKYDFQ